MPPTSPPPPPPDHAEDTPKLHTMSRGKLLTELIRHRATGRGAGGGFLATDTLGEKGGTNKPGTAGSDAVSLPLKGREELMLTRLVSSVTTQPGALPL